MPSKKNILFVDLRKNIQADEILIFENCWKYLQGSVDLLTFRTPSNL
jgi:hypothetical protein